MRHQECIVVSFVLSHVAEHPAREAGEVLYALAGLISDQQLGRTLFERAKAIEAVNEDLQEVAHELTTFHGKSSTGKVS